MNTQQICRTLTEAASEYGLIAVLHAICGNQATVSVPLDGRRLSMPLEELDLSVRGRNALAHISCDCVGDLVDLVNSGGLASVKNLGVKTVCEIKVKLLLLAYDALSEREKTAFFEDLLQKNF